LCTGIIVMFIIKVIITITIQVAFLASRHQVHATQVSSLQTGLFRASRDCNSEKHK